MDDNEELKPLDELFDEKDKKQIEDSYIENLLKSLLGGAIAVYDARQIRIDPSSLSKIDVFADDKICFYKCPPSHANTLKLVEKIRAISGTEKGGWGMFYVDIKKPDKLAIPPEWDKLVEIKNKETSESGYKIEVSIKEWVELAIYSLRYQPESE